MTHQLITVAKAVDADTDAIAALVSPTMLSIQQPKKDIWRGSPFAQVRSLKPLQKSKFARSILMQWLTQNDIRATDTTTAGNASIILPGDQLAVVKFSLLWADRTYRFQQLRDWDYHFALLLGISPFYREHLAYTTRRNTGTLYSATWE